MYILTLNAAWRQVYYGSNAAQSTRCTQTNATHKMLCSIKVLMLYFDAVLKKHCGYKNTVLNQSVVLKCDTRTKYVVFI